MDKYDQLIESEIDYEAEDYFYEQMRRAGVETKEKQIQLCYDMRNMAEEKRKFSKSI